jgi:hypothetical protein
VRSLRGGVDGVGETGPAAGHLVDLRAHQAHPEDVHPLSLGVLLSHVYLGVEVEQRPGHRRRRAVLARLGFGDESLLARLLRQERLSDGVVHLVDTAVEQILAFEVDVRTVALREPFGVGYRRRPSRVLLEHVEELRAELGRLDHVLERLGQS